MLATAASDWAPEAFDLDKYSPGGVARGRVADDPGLVGSHHMGGDGHFSRLVAPARVSG